LDKVRIAFLDRDGVLNVDHGYVYLPEQFDWMPDAKDAIRWLNKEGYKVAIVTNQSGIARGMYTEAQFLALTEWMKTDLALGGAHVDAVYFCPHHPEAGIGEYKQECDCRKPKPGMLLQGLNEFGANAEDCFFIGDYRTDMEAAQAAGVHGVLYEGGSLLELARRASLMLR
jgi:D-glycero-D-manno-heptose 1,7-bisphosphate phosphatase